MLSASFTDRTPLARNNFDFSGFRLSLNKLAEEAERIHSPSASLIHPITGVTQWPTEGAKLVMGSVDNLFRLSCVWTFISAALSPISNGSSQTMWSISSGCCIFDAYHNPMHRIAWTEVEAERKLRRQWWWCRQKPCLDRAISRPADVV